MDNHVVIIGSGLGGLTCGYILAKNGYRVTVLEKNAQIGGCLQTFTRHGVKFETGMHFIGSMEKGQTLYKFFNYLSLLPHIQLRPLDPMAYAVFSIAGDKFPYANGAENFTEQLAQYFPKERKCLEKYCSVITDVAHKSPLYSLNFTNSMVFLDVDYIRQSASGFIDSVTGNELLRGVLAGNLPLYAGIRDKTPLYVHALIHDFYNKSAFRIAGGSDIIAQSLAQSIRSMGGEIFASSEVTKIDCNNKQAIGASLKNGDTVRGDYFISNIHPARMIELLDTQMLRKAYRQRITCLKNTTGNFTIYIRFKKDTVPYFNSNYYYYKSVPDIWLGSEYPSGTWANSFLYMHLCSSLEQRFADSAILMCYMNFTEVEKWQGTRPGRRGSGYEDFKKQKAERLLEVLEREIPGTLSNIAEYYTSTPLTYLDYTGTEKGSMYGILRDCTEPIQTVVSQRTKIPNLFQTGQNINSHGILGVIIGAIITSGCLLKINTIIDRIRELSDI